MLPPFIIIIGIAIVLIETLTIYLILLGIFKFTGWKKSLRNKLLLVFSYPGIFAAVGGWIGIMFPVPSLLGAPFQLVNLFTQNDNAAWLPLPLNSLIIYQEHKAAFTFTLVELGTLALWGFLILLLTGKLQKLFR